MLAAGAGAGSDSPPPPQATRATARHVANAVRRPGVRAARRLVAIVRIGNSGSNRIVPSLAQRHASEGPQWWVKYEDKVRHLPKAGILDRCKATDTCPKVVEHFGSAEVWALKLTPEWVGTDAKKDIRLPRNVRRYYIASSTHGGGAGGFDTSLPGVSLPTAGPNCPGNNFGTGVLPANPVPHTQTVNALRVHFRNWVMLGMAHAGQRVPQVETERGA